MTARIRVMLALAALSGLAAVAAGAWGAHGQADSGAAALLKTAAEYGLAHALAVYAAFALMRAEVRFAELAGWLLLAGGIAFSWSLDLMAITRERAIGALTPLGGLLMLTGWLVLVIAALTGPRKASG